METKEIPPPIALSADDPFINAHLLPGLRCLFLCTFGARLTMCIFIHTPSLAPSVHGTKCSSVYIYITFRACTKLGQIVHSKLKLQG